VTAGLREALDRIGAFLELRLPLMHAHGAALAVTDRSETLGVVVRGLADVGSGEPVRPQTRFEIGSISKSFAAIVALQEAEAGRLDLHAPVTAYVPWLELREPFGPISMHHLLTHSSGLPIGTDDSGDEIFTVWNLRTIAPGFAPGERMHYSNDGYTLVGIVLEHVTGLPMPELLRRRIFGPLGMTSAVGEITGEERARVASGYEALYDDRPAQRAHPTVPAPWTISRSAAGSIVSNAPDMCAYARMLLARGEGPGGRLLSEASFALLTAPHVADPDEPGWTYGYGLWTAREKDGRTYLRHSGGMIGYTALLEVDPESGLAAVMLVNGTGERTSTVLYAMSAVRAAIAGEPLPEVGEPPDPTLVPDPDAYAGRYVGSDRAVEIVADRGRLLFHDGDIRVTLELDPFEKPKDGFLVPHPDRDRHYLRFARDEAGSIVEALHGPDRFVREGSGLSPQAAPLPPEWEPFPGLYRSHNPWGKGLRVVARNGVLVFSQPWEAKELELVPLADGSFRVGAEPWRPGRIRFDVVVDGRARRALLDGAALYRSFED
jgi:CubicO group peptidase (beta-lactamase class C family)